MKNENIIEVLNGLIENSRDSLVGFKKCAEYARDPSLKSYFQDRAKRYAESVRALSNEVREYEGTPNLNGSTKRAFKRVWIDLKAAFTNDDNFTVIKECERLDHITITAYQAALKKDLPNILRIILNLHLKRVERNRDQVQLLSSELENNSKKQKLHKASYITPVNELTA